jgi:hypothetical protein
LFVCPRCSKARESSVIGSPVDGEQVVERGHFFGIASVDVDCSGKEEVFARLSL